MSGCNKREETARARSRAAMWEAVERRSGMGWSAEEDAPNPVRPEAMSSTSPSPGGRGGLGQTEGQSRRRGRGRGGGGNEGRENVEPIVDGGCEGRVLYFSGEKTRRSRRAWWKKTDELHNFTMRSNTSNAIVFGNGFVKGGRNIQEPRTSKLRRPRGITFTYTTGGECKIF